MRNANGRSLGGEPHAVGHEMVDVHGRRHVDAAAGEGQAVDVALDERHSAGRVRGVREVARLVAQHVEYAR